MKTLNQARYSEIKIIKPGMFQYCIIKINLTLEKTPVVILSHHLN